MTAWQGWRALGERPSVTTWVDASHPLSGGLPNPAYFPPPEFRRLLSLPEDALNLTAMSIVCHFGTHVDAPSHLVDGGPTIDQVPLERFCGPGVVWRIEAEPDGVIDRRDLMTARPAAQPGDIVALSTGWCESIGTSRYGHHPRLSEEAAAWLVAQDVKLLAIDFVTPDLAIAHRPPGFDFPVHRILLGAGVLIAENLTNLRQFEGRRVEVLMVPLPIVGSDGSPVRVLIR